MSSVISTALKSYYLNVNDEWIDRGCQEQYLFVCPGQPWLFLFNSIPPLPLSVIDNWCDVTLPSEDVEFFSGKNTPGRLVIARCWAAAEHFVVLASVSQVTTWHWSDPQGAGGLAGRKVPLSPLICPQTVPPWPCRLLQPRALCLCEVVQPGRVIFFMNFLFFFWKTCEHVLQTGNLGWARSLWFNTEGSRDRAQRTVLHNTARGKIQTSTFFPLNFHWSQLLAGASARPDSRSAHAHSRVRFEIAFKMSVLCFFQIQQTHRRNNRFRFEVNY